MSASSCCVTCGIVTQLRCRFAAESLRMRCSGWISVGPNFAKSICGGAATDTPAIGTPAAVPFSIMLFT